MQPYHGLSREEWEAQMQRVNKARFQERVKSMLDETDMVAKEIATDLREGLLSRKLAAARMRLNITSASVIIERLEREAADEASD